MFSCVAERILEMSLALHSQMFRGAPLVIKRCLSTSLAAAAEPAHAELVTRHEFALLKRQVDALVEELGPRARKPADTNKGSLLEMLDRMTMTAQLDAILHNVKVIMDNIMDLKSRKKGIFQD